MLKSPEVREIELKRSVCGSRTRMCKMHPTVSPDALFGKPPAISHAMMKVPRGISAQRFCWVNEWWPAVLPMPPDPAWLSSVCEQSGSYDTDTSVTCRFSRPETIPAYHRTQSRIFWTHSGATNLYRRDSQKHSHTGRTCAIGFYCGTHLWLS